MVMLDRTVIDCDHKRTLLVVRTLANASKAYYMQCQRCGGVASPAISKAKASELLQQANNSLEFCPPWNDKLGRDWNAKRTEAYESARLERMASFEDERIEHTERYQAYLLTPEWRTKRAAVMDRADGLCEGCRAADATEVHHTTYKHIFNELLFELVALCRDCHERAHS
jgi:hypothetical protein